MELILLEKVLNLGDLGDKVDVKSGYGRNFLVPQGKAVPATRENVEMFEARRAELEAAESEKLGSAEARKEGLADLVIELTANASEEGKLFGSIGPREIAMAATEKGQPLEKSEVAMGEGPIRETGEHEVVIQLHADVETTIRVVVHGAE
jgi:large subunit ribosomal protein L9